MNLAFSNAFDIKVGTITMIINMIFLAMYMYMTGMKHKKKYAIQIFSVVLFGSVINLFTYDVFGDLIIEHYALRLITVAAGTFIGGLSIGMIVNYNTITFPIESVCVELERKTKHSFTKLRYSIDIVSILLSIVISTAYMLPLYVREGTIISLFIFTFTMGYVKELYTNKKNILA